MTKCLSLGVLALSLVASPLVQAQGQPPADQPKASTDAKPPEKITDKSHPDYVRCRTEPVIGSRAKFRKVCLTNRQWAEVQRDGNSLANQMVEENRSRPSGN